MISEKAIRQAGLALFTGVVASISANICGASEPVYCEFELAKTFPTEEMVASLRSFASENTDLWEQIDEARYQKFSGFSWADFQNHRKDIDAYCSCVYPHFGEVDTNELQALFRKNVEAYNESEKKIKDYESSWIKYGKDKPLKYQVSKESLLWSCKDREFFIPEFDFSHFETSFIAINDVLSTIFGHITAAHGVKAKPIVVKTLHQEVLKTGRKAKAKLLDRITELSVNMEPDTASITPKFDSSFLPHLEKAQKEGKEIYSYLEFYSGDEELLRYYAKITVRRGKEGKISALEVYDPMIMQQLVFKVDESGKSTKLPEFYLDLARALMKKHHISNIRQISKVKYKVLYLSDKNNEQQNSEL